MLAWITPCKLFALYAVKDRLCVGAIHESPEKLRK